MIWVAFFLGLHLCSLWFRRVLGPPAPPWKWCRSSTGHLNYLKEWKLTVGTNCYANRISTIPPTIKTTYGNLFQIRSWNQTSTQLLVKSWSKVFDLHIRKTILGWEGEGVNSVNSNNLHLLLFWWTKSSSVIQSTVEKFLRYLLQYLFKQRRNWGRGKLALNIKWPTSTDNNTLLRFAWPQEISSVHSFTVIALSNIIEIPDWIVHLAQPHPLGWYFFGQFPAEYIS
jgi:hypothetical protein